MTKPLFPLTRRDVLRLMLVGAAGHSFPHYARAATLQEQAEAKVKQAHAEIWRRFIDPNGVLLDYTDREGQYPNPTPEECAAGKPNALGWWTPVENGSMFNGMYMEGILARWEQTKEPEDAAKVRRLMQGMLELASLGPRGFLARNVCADGKTSYPMGSNDQTGPWLYGAWRYATSALATPEEKQVLTAKFLEVAETLHASRWMMPCREGAPSKFRGAMGNHNWEAAPRLLFMLKAAHQLSREEKWAKLYTELAHEKKGEPALSRIEICAAGMVFHNPRHRECWTGASGVTALRGLWEMETDPAIKAAYAQGLVKSAELAAPGLELAAKFNDQVEVMLTDWRVLNEWWRPQTSEKEAVEVAEAEAKQLGPKSPRRYQEFTFMREPVFAAWVVALCPEKAVVAKYRNAIYETLARYDYTRLYYSQFFPAEAAWYRLQGG